MSKIIRLYDRSRVVKDWTCPRARFYNYEYKRRGIVQQTTSLELFTGIVTHDALAAIAKGIDPREIAQAAYDQMHASLLLSVGDREDGAEFAAEQATLTQGLILGFAKHQWPLILADYPEILYVEAENEYRHNAEELTETQASTQEGEAVQRVGSASDSKPSLLFMSKPDLIARGPGGVAYIEYKTTKSKKDDWINSWDTAVQLHSSIKAVKQTLDIDIDHVIVQGLYKAYSGYGGKQSSPFCYAYTKRGNPPFTKDSVLYEYKYGYNRTPTWELPGGIEKWVADMPSNVLADQFPRTPPIFVNEEQVARFFAQREIREQEIALTMDLLDKYSDSPTMTEYLMDSVFPQKFEQCAPAWGYPCEFRKLCFGFVTDPLNEGYVWREPHHQKELDQFAEKEINEDS